MVEKAEVATAAISPHPQQGLQGQGSKRVSVKINVADVDEEPEGNDHDDWRHTSLCEKFRIFLSPDRYFVKLTYSVSTVRLFLH